MQPTESPQLVATGKVAEAKAREAEAMVAEETAQGAEATVEQKVIAVVAKRSTRCTQSNWKTTRTSRSTGACSDHTK